MADAPGAVADLLSTHPNLTPDQVKGLLKVTATHEEPDEMEPLTEDDDMKDFDEKDW